MTAVDAILKVYFSSPEAKGQFTWILVESIMVTCRSNIAEIVLLNRRPVGLKLDVNHWGVFLSKNS